MSMISDMPKYYILFLMLRLLTFIAAENCEFSTVNGAATYIDEAYDQIEQILVIIFEMSEATNTSERLYSVAWNASFESYIIEEESSAFNFMNFSLNRNNKSADVILAESILEMVDFDNPNAKDELLLSVQYAFENDTTCTLQLLHNILDENTKPPSFDHSVYEVSIREDYPLNLTILDLELMAVDYDASVPNNKFNVTLDGSCPLQSSSSFYVTPEGIPVFVDLVLKEELDYDATEQIKQNCSLLLMDYGVPPMNSSSTITIELLDINDETPVFSSTYYSGFVASVVAGSDVETDPDISATDRDAGGADPFKYSIIEANPDSDGADTYFTINETTGIITVSNDLPPTLIALHQVEFIIHATDNYNHVGEAFLTIHFPSANTNETNLNFELASYAAQIFSPIKNQIVLRVHAITSSENAIFYSIEGESPYFDIDSGTGEVFCLQNSTPADVTYTLTILAQVDELAASCFANIYVDEINQTDSIMTDSVVNTQITENYTGFIITVKAENEGTFCLVDVEPQKYFGYFYVDPDTGDVFMISSVVNDEAREIALRIAYAHSGVICPERRVLGTSKNIQKNETILYITVNDINDNKPYFTNPTMNTSIIAYPANEALQRTVGPVMKVQALDIDNVDTLSFSITDPSGTFVMDSKSGDIFLYGSFNCDNITGCDITAHVSDGNFNHEDSVHIKIFGLSVDYISTMTFQDENIDSIDELLLEISENINVQILQLYSTIIDEVTPNEKENSQFEFDVHVYALNGTAFLSLSQLNNKLSEAGYEEAKSFTDKEIFDSEDGVSGGGNNDNFEDELKTYKIITGILAGLLGLLIIAVIAAAILLRKKKLPPPRISTLTQAYRDSLQTPIVDGEKNETFDGISNTSSSTKDAFATIPSISASNTVIIDQIQDESHFRATSHSSDYLQKQPNSTNGLKKIESDQQPSIVPPTSEDLNEDNTKYVSFKVLSQAIVYDEAGEKTSDDIAILTRISNDDADSMKL